MNNWFVISNTKLILTSDLILHDQRSENYSHFLASFWYDLFSSLLTITNGLYYSTKYTEVFAEADKKEADKNDKQK